MSTLINNRYRPLKLLGSGGSGQTYLAEDTHLPSNRRCVIKKLRPPTDNPTTYEIIKERFHREAVILESLGKSTEQIPKLHAYFAEGQEFYLVQDWIDGQNIGQKVRTDGLLSDAQVIDFLRRILPVLAFVHSQGIVHRDLKPENIMLRAVDDLPVLIDFGAVKEVIADVSTTIIIGSPGYMPPEQANGKPVFSSDLYSLGFTAAYMLSGKRPQDLTDYGDDSFLTREPFKSTNPALTRVIAKATRLLAHERYQTAGTMLAALNGVGVPTVISEDSTLITESRDVEDFEIDVSHARPKNRGTNHPFVYIVLGIVVLVLASSAIVFFYARQKNTLANVNTRPVDSSQTAEFEITRTNDLFTTVRAAPRTSSPELGKLYPDTKIVCQTTTVKGETLWSNNDWRYCPSVGGYIHSTLLRPSDR